MNRHSPILLLLLALLLAACGRPSLPSAEMPDDGPPIAVSQEAALRFIEKINAAGQNAASTRSSQITMTQEEVTSFLSIGTMLAEQLQRVQSLENPESLEQLQQLEGAQGLEGIKELEAFQRLAEQRDGLPELRLPDLSLQVAIKEPQVYFKGNGHIVIRGYGELSGRRQPLRIVVAPRAAGGELVLDFVEGQLGPVPVPELLFDQVGKGMAQVILAGQAYAEISEITVGEGTLSLAGSWKR